jgi:hypothetical protein
MMRPLPQESDGPPGHCFICFTNRVDTAMVPVFEKRLPLLSLSLFLVYFLYSRQLAAESGPGKEKMTKAGTCLEEEDH